MSNKQIITDKIIKSEMVKWKDFEFLQSKNFKELTEDAYNKLKQSIIKNHSIQSFKVWQDGKTIYCLDGYHRCLILRELENEGYKIPEKLRAEFVDCKNKKEAAKLVAIYSSIYANITDEGLYEFLNIQKINIEDIKFEINIPGIDIDYFIQGYLTDEKIKEKDYDENIPVEKECPRCGYKW